MKAKHPHKEFTSNVISLAAWQEKPRQAQHNFGRGRSHRRNGWNGRPMHAQDDGPRAA